jgi:glutaredoxin
MTYKLFTFPNCGKCNEVKNYLKEKEIKYEEVNAGIGDGRTKFRDFYSKNKEQIKRDESGAIPLPIFEYNGKILQGLEGITKNLNL